MANLIANDTFSTGAVSMYDGEIRNVTDSDTYAAQYVTLASEGYVQAYSGGGGGNRLIIPEQTVTMSGVFALTGVTISPDSLEVGDLATLYAEAMGSSDDVVMTVVDNEGSLEYEGEFSNVPLRVFYNDGWYMDGNLYGIEATIRMISGIVPEPVVPIFAIIRVKKNSSLSTYGIRGCSLYWDEDASEVKYAWVDITDMYSNHNVPLTGTSGVCYPLEIVASSSAPTLTISGASGELVGSFTDTNTDKHYIVMVGMGDELTLSAQA